MSNSKKVSVHGHRGSRGSHPENTLVAFEEAFHSRADAFELDIQWTKDEVAIVFHDFDLSARVCTKSGVGPVQPLPIIKTSWEEIGSWDVGSVTQVKYPQQKLSPQKILSLDQTLAWLAKKPARFSVDLEMKVDPAWSDSLIQKFTAQVLETISKHNLSDRCLLMSFDFRPLITARSALPGIKLSCLFDSKMDFVAKALAVGAKIIGPHYSLLTENLISNAHEAKLQVIPWTVNKESDWKQLVEWRVDGLITDYPRDLFLYLAK